MSSRPGSAAALEPRRSRRVKLQLAGSRLASGTSYGGCTPEIKGKQLACRKSAEAVVSTTSAVTGCNEQRLDGTTSSYQSCLPRGNQSTRSPACHHAHPLSRRRLLPGSFSFQNQRALFQAAPAGGCPASGASTILVKTGAVLTSLPRRAEGTIPSAYAPARFRGGTRTLASSLSWYPPAYRGC